MRTVYKNFLVYKPFVKVFLLLLLVIVPWLGLQSNSQLIPPPPSQEDLTFYEINPCKVSLTTFLKNNFNTFYQDHFFFRFNSSSPLSCFGLISGGTLIGTDLYISVGTNPLVNLIIQSSFLTLLISFLKKDKSTHQLDNKILHIFSLGATSILLCLFIFSEDRFYQLTFYQLDTTDRRYLVIFFTAAVFVIKNLIMTSLPRMKRLIYYIPASYLIIGVIDGFNLHLVSFLFIYFGFLSLSNFKNFKTTHLYLLITVSFWIMNSAYTGSGFFFQPGKLRGFTSSVYSFYSTFIWSTYFVLLIIGLFYVFKTYLFKLDLDKLTKILATTSIPLIVLGYLGANFPIVNLLNYYYFGQQKYGVTLKNPFFFNEWSEKVSWRGFYPSAETVGEYFGLVLILIFFTYRKNGKSSIIEIFGGLCALMGLYFSNNRAAFIFIVFTIIYFLTQKISNKFRIIFFVLFTIFFLNIVGFQNLGYDYDFTSNSIINQANKYQLQEQSSFLEFLNNAKEENSSSLSTIKLISAGSFLLNRGELWGLFASRYNPTYFELLLGSGPLNFGQLYGEIDIKPTKGMLLPHSSILSYLLFIGVVGIGLCLFIFLKKLYTNRKNINANGYILLTYLIVNITKNDSLNYFPTFTLYFLITYVILNFNNTKIFE